MRLMNSELYRGKRIRVYLLHSETALSPTAMLAVRIDGEVVEDTPWLAGVTDEADALAWGRAAIDRTLGPDGHDPMMPTSPV